MVPVPSDEPSKKRSASDYIFGKVIGEGSFSTVYLAKDIHSNKEFAIKVLEKLHIKKERKMEYVKREKDVLLLLSGCNRLFVRLYCTFQDTDRLYFVLTYAKHGDFLSYINKGLPPECVRYYAAELVLALEVLNSKKIIHRDLKPENILLDENWHILLTDFGSAKIVGDGPEEEEEETSGKRKNSFVGTAQYVTPEVLTDNGATFASDLWSLGCVVYQMVSGQFPFRAGSEYLTFKKILGLEYEFPEDFDPSAKDLVQSLLVIEPESRLGAADDRPYTSLREHVYFTGVNWDDMGRPPPITDVPRRNSETDNRISDDLEPGFDERKAGRLQLEMFCPTTPHSASHLWEDRLTPCAPTRKKSDSNRNIADLDEAEIGRRLELQAREPWHSLVEGNLILKQGLVDKKKGLFPRRRMFLLTMGPHLYYVDPVTMVLKGEVPWGPDIRAEAKKFKTFFVHTPNRIYYLEDPEGYALEWCKAIDEVKAFYASKMPS